MKRKRSIFYLGDLTSGRLYFFTQLGTFRTHAEAVAYFDSKPRNARERAVVIEQIPLVKNGIEWGFDQIVWDLNGNRLQ